MAYKQPESTVFKYLEEIGEIDNCNSGFTTPHLYKFGWHDSRFCIYVTKNYVYIYYPYITNDNEYQKYQFDLNWGEVITAEIKEALDKFLIEKDFYEL